MEKEEYSFSEYLKYRNKNKCVCGCDPHCGQSCDICEMCPDCECERCLKELN